MEWEKILNELGAAILVEIMLNGTKSASTKVVAKVKGWRRVTPTEREAEVVMVKTGLWHWYELYPYKKVRFVDPK